VTDTPLDGDLLGHDTYGLALLTPYMDQIGKGFLKVANDYEVLKDRGMRPAKSS
jgi:LDH2 family malate/lactate/ureidoglycolate dehydrogenase